jgi:hypothetical protein
MLKYVIRKWFFDCWDHLGFLLVSNIFFTFSIVLVLMPGFNQTVQLFFLSLALNIAGGLLFFLQIATVVESIQHISDFGRPGFSQWLPSLKAHWSSVLIFGVVTMIVISSIRFGLYAMPTIMGPSALIPQALLFWALVIWLGFSAWFVPLETETNSSGFVNIRKSFLLSMDNPGMIVLLLAGSVLILGLSIVTFTVFPGVLGLILWHKTLLRVTLLAYEWREEHHLAPGDKVPWTRVLPAEQRKIGPRSLKSFFFPGRGD